MVSLQEVYQFCRAKLTDAEVENAAFEARELVRHVYGYSVEAFVREKRTLVDADAVEEFLVRRLQGEPLAYLIGEWDFYGLTLKVTQDVLIPRSDTETLVDAALQFPCERFLDLCTGSGCVGVALAHEREESTGVLLDLSEPALKVARENIARYGLEPRLQVVHGDVCRAPSQTLGKFDLIVSNPPYITLSEMQELDRSVGFFEPESALYGGVDGYTYYDAILNRWLSLLRPGGVIAMECGYRQARGLAERMEGVRLTNIEIKQDTAGIERVVLGVRK